MPHIYIHINNIDVVNSPRRTLKLLHCSEDGNKYSTSFVNLLIKWYSLFGQESTCLSIESNSKNYKIAEISKS